MFDIPASFAGASADDRPASPGGAGAGRYAPSPTGELHLGNLRTALLAWLFARSSGRRLLLRIEDLDAARVRPGMADQQLADLAALGITFDGEPCRAVTAAGRVPGGAGEAGRQDLRMLLQPAGDRRGRVGTARKAWPAIPAPAGI